MNPAPADLIARWYETFVAYLPGVLGAVIVLVIGWIAGRLLGKAVRIVLDKISEQHLVKEGADLAAISGSVKNAGLTVGYLGDIFTRIVVYLIAILAAVDILNMDYLSNLMTAILGYIPHVVAFVVILTAGFLLADYFIDFLGRYYANQEIALITPVLFVLRIFLYFVIAILGLSQLMLDLTIIYTFVTPIAWGVGLGLGGAIALFAAFGLRGHSEAIMDKLIESIAKKP